MSNPYVGEIRMFAGNYAPAGWAFCDGSLLPISENDVLFQLIGTTFGGDGEANFALPNLLGRAPVHSGTSPSTGTAYTLGEMAGVEQVTLTTQQIPVHTHPLLGTTNQATTNTIGGNVPATMLAAGTNSAYGTDPPSRTLSADSISAVGGSQPHYNMQPYLVLNFIMSLFGIYPNQ